MYFLAALITLYVGAMVYLGYRGYRATQNVSDYLLAGRKANPFVMAMSYGAAFISTSAIVGFGGAAAVYGMGLLWLVFLNIFVGIFLAFVVVGVRTRSVGRSLDAHTFPELMGKRYESGFIQLFMALVVLLFMPLYAGVVLMGAAKFIEVRLGISYEAALVGYAVLVAIYVALGGLKGIMYADALQGTIMLCGMALLLIVSYARLGGPIPAHDELTALAPMAIQTFGAQGHQGFTSMPVGGSALWWTLTSSIVLGVGIGVLAQPQLVVRYMTVKSGKELNRACMVGGLFILAVTGGAFIAGALSNVYFFRDTGQIAFLAVNKDIEQIIPRFITGYMPSWLGDLFFVTLLAAGTSTATSQFHAMGAAAGRDVFCGISRPLSGKHTILVTRLGIFVTFLVSLALAYALPVRFSGTGTAIIARGTAIFFGVCAATFLPMYIGGLYSRRITKEAAIAGAITGFAVSVFWLLFMHQKESSALLVCNALFGKPSLVVNARTGFILWPEVDPLVVALPASILVTLVVSLVTQPMRHEHLARCFPRMKQGESA